jgi:hypothetical protein
VTFEDAEREHHVRDDELSAAARAMHREWHSPELWPRIVAGISKQDVEGPARGSDWWRIVAAAAVILVALGSTWLGWRRFAQGPGDEAAARRLLTEEALAAIEQSETQYVQAIDELTRLTAPKMEMPDSPLLVNLRDRLALIDAAIAEYRAEVDRNRFNAHLRRQLLWIYQEKRRTLEQIQEYDPDAL